MVFPGCICGNAWIFILRHGVHLKGGEFMFTTYEEKVVDRIGLLQSQANLLLGQKKQVKKDKFLSDGYTIAISEILSAITRLSKELAKEKEPTDGNQ